MQLSALTGRREHLQCFQCQLRIEDYYVNPFQLGYGSFVKFEALAGITGGDRVVEFGAAPVAELPAKPAVALPAAKGRCAGADLP
jgi:hypothetical protein